MITREDLHPSLTNINFKPVRKALAWLEAGAPDTNTESPMIGDKLIGFNMREYVRETDCGTICCIGGAIAAFDPKTQQSNPTSWEIIKLLGFNPDDFIAGSVGTELRKLFNPDENDFGPSVIKEAYKATPERAARVFEHFLRTGIADWSIP